MLRRTLLVAALAVAATSMNAQGCDVTKLKAAFAECADFWSSSWLIFMRGYCDAGYMMFCDLL